MEELFTVKEVISGDTITVIPDWKWKKKKGSAVSISGYNAPKEDSPGYEDAKNKLKELILGKKLSLTSQR